MLKHYRNSRWYCGFDVEKQRFSLGVTCRFYRIGVELDLSIGPLTVWVGRERR